MKIALLFTLLALLMGYSYTDQGPWGAGESQAAVEKTTWTDLKAKWGRADEDTTPKLTGDGDQPEIIIVDYWEKDAKLPAPIAID